MDCSKARMFFKASWEGLPLARTVYVYVCVVGRGECSIFAVVCSTRREEEEERKGGGKGGKKGIRASVRY